MWQSLCREHDTIPSRSHCWQQLAPVHFPKTHPQPRERKNSFSVLWPQLCREFLLLLAVNREAPLSFFTGYHFMIICPKRHLAGYSIYSVLVLLPDRYGFQTLSYSVSLHFSEKHQTCYRYSTGLHLKD